MGFHGKPPENKYLLAIFKMWISKPYMVVLYTSVLIAVLGEDIQILILPLAADKGYKWISYFVVFLVFLFDFIFNLMFGKKQYITSVFFFLDILSVLSMVPGLLTVFGYDPFADSRALIAARLSRAAKAASRSGKFIKFLKAVRVLIVKFTFGTSHEGEDERDEITPTQAGEKLYHLTTRNVIILVMSMFFLSVALAFWRQSDDYLEAYHLGLDNMMTINETATNQVLADQLNIFYLQNVINLVANNDTFFHSPQRIDELRKVEMLNYTIDEYNMVVICIRDQKVLEAIINIVQTFVLLFVLSIGNYVFMKDANRYLIAPISAMSHLIHSIRDSYKMVSLPFNTKPLSADQEGQFILQFLQATLELLSNQVGPSAASIVAEQVKADVQHVPSPKIMAMLSLRKHPCNLHLNPKAERCFKNYMTKMARLIMHHIHAVGSRMELCGDGFLMVWVNPNDESATDALLTCATIMNKVDQLSAQHYEILGNFDQTPQWACALHYDNADQHHLPTTFGLETFYETKAISVLQEMVSFNKSLDKDILLSAAYRNLLPDFIQPYSNSQLFERALTCHSTVNVKNTVSSTKEEVYTLSHGIYNLFPREEDLFSGANNGRKPSFLRLQDGDDTAKTSTSTKMVPTDVEMDVTTMVADDIDRRRKSLIPPNDDPSSLPSGGWRTQSSKETKVASTTALRLERMRINGTAKPQPVMITVNIGSYYKACIVDPFGAVVAGPQTPPINYDPENQKNENPNRSVSASGEFDFEGLAFEMPIPINSRAVRITIHGFSGSLPVYLGSAQMEMSEIRDDWIRVSNPNKDKEDAYEIVMKMPTSYNPLSDKKYSSSLKMANVGNLPGQPQATSDDKETQEIV